MKKRTFNGDILITDPCYIIREDRDEDWQAVALVHI